MEPPEADHELLRLLDEAKPLGCASRWKRTPFGDLTLLCDCGAPAESSPEIFFYLGESAAALSCRPAIDDGNSSDELAKPAEDSASGAAAGFGRSNDWNPLPAASSTDDDGESTGAAGSFASGAALAGGGAGQEALPVEEIVERRLYALYKVSKQQENGRRHQRKGI